MSEDAITVCEFCKKPLILGGPEVQECDHNKAAIQLLKTATASVKAAWRLYESAREECLRKREDEPMDGPSTRAFYAARNDFIAEADRFARTLPF